MKAQPLPLINGFYADETRPWSQQDICNYLPCAAEQEGTRTPTLAKTPPGLSPFARIASEPVRGVYSAEDRLFAVMGNTLYQITPTVATALGSISGAGRVRFAHNQITGGNQVLIVNGSAGWVWNTVTSTLTAITDTGYPGAINARFIDGYLIQIEPARRFAFHSDLADALSYNTLDRFTSEVSPDMLVSMAVSNNELILFSERTTEFFENTGATQQPFRSKRISFNKGCAGRYTVAEMDNTVFWLGDDGVFYLLDGYSPRRISNRPIEQAIRGLNWAQAFAFVWEDSGHSVCYWTFPDGQTWGYDASQQKWHRRASYGFDRWRVQDVTYWQNRWIAGDFQKGRLWELDWSYPYEHDQEFISELTAPVIHDHQSRVLMPRLEVIVDTGQDEVAVRDFSIGPALLALSGNLPDGLVNDEVSFQYTVTGGVAPYAFTIESGALPAGLSMDVAGLVTGTLTTRANYSWTVRVIDGDGDTDDLADTCAVSEISWPSFGWTTYNDADAAASGQSKPVFAPDITTTVGLGGAFAVPPYSLNGGTSLQANATTLNGGDGDWSPTLGLFSVLRGNTDRLWSSTTGQSYTNHLQPTNFVGEPAGCWASDTATPEFFWLFSDTDADAKWCRSTTGQAIASSGANTGTIPRDVKTVIRAPGRYYAFSHGTGTTATTRIMHGVTGQSDWAAIGNIDTHWRDAKYCARLGKVFACGYKTGDTASRKVISIDISTQAITDITPASMPAAWYPTGIDDAPEMGVLGLVGNEDASSGETSAYTSPTGASSASWTEHAATFPKGLFGQLRWQSAGTFYRWVTFRAGGLRGNGVAYSNTTVTPP